MASYFKQRHLHVCIGCENGDHGVALHKRWVSIDSLFISTNTVYPNPLLKQFHRVFDIDSVIHKNQIAYKVFLLNLSQELDNEIHFAA